MKNKLKFLPLLFALPLTTGICGASLHAAQQSLPIESAANSSPLYGLIIVSIVALLMAVIAAFLLKKGVDYSSVFLTKALPTASFVSAAIILLYAGILIFSLFEGFSGLTLVIALLSVYACVSIIALGKYKLAERDDQSYCIFSAVPVFWIAFILVVTFREKIADPIISNYVFLILSYISILLFGYATCAHVLGKKRKHIAVFACFIGIFFILVELLTPLFGEGYSFATAFDAKDLLPLLAFLVIMPFYTAEITRKKD